MTLNLYTLRATKMYYRTMHCAFFGMRAFSTKVYTARDRV